MAQTLQQVNAAISRIQSTLPPTAQIDTHRLDFASFPILGYSLTSDKVPQTQLWELATYDLKPRLNRLNGVASVLVQGGQAAGISDHAGSARMLRAHVTLQDILDAVNQTEPDRFARLADPQSPAFPGPDRRRRCRRPSRSATSSSRTRTTCRCRFAISAAVGPSTAPNYTVVTANGKPAVLLSINRQPDSNTVEVANEVHQEIESLRSALPPGVQLSVFYDQSNIVRESIGSVRDAIIIGLFLTGFIIWLFLRDLGTAIMTGVVVPVTICVTFVVLKMMGQSFNMMTLGGLAAAGGLVIDDAIVVVENIVLHRDGGEGPLEATSKALKELTVPLIGSTLTPIVVFLPLISITGVTGTFFRALAVAMSVSLLDFAGAGLELDHQSGHLPDPPQAPIARAANGNGENGMETNSGRRFSRRIAPMEPEDCRAGRNAPHDGRRRGLAAGRLLRAHPQILRALGAPRPGASRLAWRASALILIVVSYLCYTPSGQRSAAGHGRRRLRSRLRDAAGQFACRRPIA